MTSSALMDCCSVNSFRCLARGSLGPPADVSGDVSTLLARVRAEVGALAERDVRVYYAALCELYNRSLADTILTAPNSPRWDRYVAAMDLWREHVLDDTDDEASSINDLDVVVKLPRPYHLRRVSGDVLFALRRSPSCERYFESLAHWRAAPHEQTLQGELVESLSAYAREIMKTVGKDVGALGLRPQFISKVSDVSRALERVPGVVQGFLAVGAAAGAGGRRPARIRRYPRLGCSPCSVSRRRPNTTHHPTRLKYSSEQAKESVSAQTSQLVVRST